MADKLTIEQMKNLAARHGGYCLSEDYFNSKQKLKWQCSQGQWCKYCAGLAPKNITDISDFVQKKRGTLISDTYKNSKALLKVRCEYGHSFSIRWNDLQQGHWCTFCAGHPILTEDDMHRLASAKGGHFISRIYTHSKDYHEWECAQGHKFSMIPNAVQQGVWCSICSRKLREKIVRQYFETILGGDFPPSRPDWLRIKSGNKVELDGYNEAYSLAFEHQGIQHYRWTKFFQQSEADFKLQLARDAEKRILCIKNNVRLIEVPHFIKIENLQAFLIKRFEELNLPIQEDAKNLKIKFSDIYEISELTRLRKITETCEIKCTSSEYKGSSTPLDFVCSLGHTFSRTPSSFFQGSRDCPRCKGIKKHIIEDMQEFAASKNGECLSPTYKDNKTQLTWKCENGHTFRLNWNKVSGRGQWCKICKKN